LIPVVSEHRLADPDSEGLRPLFAAALESGRSRADLLGTLLSASLSLAGADLAVVCSPDGTPLASAREPDAVGDVPEFIARALGEPAPAGPAQEGLYLIQLAVSPPAYLAVRWARARLARPDVVQAIAAACARLLASPQRELPGRPEDGHAAALRQLGDALAVAERAGTRVGVLSIGLEAFGRAAAGDAIATAVAGLQGALRRGDVLVRVAADELVAVLGVVRDEAELADAATRFVERAGRPHDPAGPAPSIGIAVSPDDGTNAEALLQHAGQARQGGDPAHPVNWYRDAVGRELIARRALRARLHGADLERDFLLCFQPIVAAATMRVVGAEALIRWRHPSRGWLAPRTFLAAPVAPVLSPRLQGWVIEAIAQALRAWGPAAELRVHVNLQAGDAETRAELERAFAATGVDAARFAVETSAGAALADPETSAAFLGGLRERGVAIGLDGIGLPGTPLEALSLIPLDFVKIAPQVTQRAAADPAAMRTARAALGAARGLELRTIADGIESFEQARWWTASGVTELAGYYFGQPMTAPDFSDWLASAHLSLRKAQ
jgi:EAL domain-containing protein (putative c-di-GMP-specific phosphodiesterase class I)